MRDAIAIDFDGTLCTNKYPEIGRPITLVINAAKKRQAEGCGLILWTCREGELLEKAISWCLDHGLKFDAVNESLPEWKEMFVNDPRKVGATEYWDDRSRNPLLLSEKKKKSLLGEKCICKGYLKKVKDGAYIQRFSPDQTMDHQEHYVLHSRELDIAASKKNTRTPFDDDVDFDFMIDAAEREDDGKFVPEYDERESRCCGEHELLKTYYERKEMNFSGVIVGRKRVVAKGWLVVDTVTPYYSPEYCVIRKEPEESIDCAIVYYAEGKKRYVPFEDLTITEQ